MVRAHNSYTTSKLSQVVAPSMASSSHEDHTDLDSLFGDAEYQDDFLELLSYHKTHSIPPTMSAVSQAHSYSSKRNASPGLSPQTKRRRVDIEDRVSADNPKSVLGNLGLAVGTGNTLTQAKLKSVAGLLAPPTNTPRNVSRPKGKNNPLPCSSTRPVTSGTGTATDPVILSDEPPSQSPFPTSSTGTRRITRSQEARILLDALPDDPSDVLTQTLRTILKTPTAIPRGRTSVSRDTAVYLANGRLTGTPFLRLLRHLASPARSANPALGLALLKKLVEAMRATEDAASKSTPPGPSSAASTPMPTTPSTPSTATFAPHDGSSYHCPVEQVFEPSLFSEVESSTIGLGPLPLPTITEVDAVAQMDIVIDPELLALSNDPGYLQASNVCEDFDTFHVDLEELFRALPQGSGSAVPTNESVPMLEPLTTGPFIDWGTLVNLPIEGHLAGWPQQEHHLATDLIQTGVQTFPAPAPTTREPGLSTHPVHDQGLKQQGHSSGTVRIPARAEALALLERAHARKKEVEQKLLIARRQLWGCKIEAGVERNVLEALKRAQ
ncbi:hypothetical protein RSOLAG1IB_01518 [Rhizoctonia solani AG-1 IB]|uniref:Uncharacterized protein n=1 Tax=Thanatephorus cucumeris (strain AG1-IB / isolate 7/3/14) TaxID=1108050 RepID=A0A0B7FBT8_THACB|nr:hypothetical protein RSOLAG1IB_01518 [Rhizoctonia solani AG-1 IB]